MTAESHHNAPLDLSPTLDDSAFGWPTQTAWDREQADTPPFTPWSVAELTLGALASTIGAVVAVVLVVIAFNVADVIEPYWPVLLARMTP